MRGDLRRAKGGRKFFRERRVGSCANFEEDGDIGFGTAFKCCNKTPFNLDRNIVFFATC